jgi:sugar/nucleoside kinase (ribokinase family)
LPNDAEAAVLTGQIDPLEAICVFRNWGAHGLVVTLGDRGAIGALGNECWRCNAYPWQTVDPSGAGDAFASGLITGIAKSWDFPRSLVYASALGASATRAVGTTDGVLTNIQAEQLITAQPVTLSNEYLPHTG